MAFKMLLSTSAWDAVAYIRARTEDSAQPPMIPDSSYKAYAEEAIEEYSRMAPLERQIGSALPQLTSPFMTVTNQQRYLCNATNGFTTGAPMNILEVSYRPAGGFNASNEVIYLSMLPDAVSLLSFDIESPVTRLLRDQTLSEISHYAVGFYSAIRDVSGLLAIDLYPIPTMALPVEVRYTLMHPQTIVGGNFAYVTIPEDHKRLVANLLYATVLEEETERLSKFRKVRAGMIENNTNPNGLYQLAQSLRDDVYNNLGGAVGAISRST